MSLIDDLMDAGLPVNLNGNWTREPTAQERGLYEALKVSLMDKDKRRAAWLARPDLAARADDAQDVIANRRELREQYRSAMETLTQIIDARTLNNQQVVTAIKQMARIQRATLRILARQYKELRDGRQEN